MTVHQLTHGHSPPTVVLRPQLHIRAQHRHLHRHQHSEHADHEHKAEQVVEVAKPQGGHCKVELDEYGAKRQDAGCKGLKEKRG